MPAQTTVTQVRLNNISSCLDTTANTIEILATTSKNPFLVAIANTTQSLLKLVQMIRKNKSECAQLLEGTNSLVNAIIMVYITSNTGTRLPPGILKEIGKFTEILHKIHTFVEAQQRSSRVRRFFRQGEMSLLLKDCKTGLQQGLEFFQLETSGLVADIKQLQENALRQHEEVLNMIETFSDTSSVEVGQIYASSYTSSASISMLPSEPKIFYGREKEIAAILDLFQQGTPRIVVLGAGGMGKTSLARITLHHPDIAARYGQHRLFVNTDSISNTVELAAHMGAQLGLKSAVDLTQPLMQHLSAGPPCLLVLDNLETIWEPTETRKNVENFLSLITQVAHLALVVTMRGAERPANVSWTHPFLPPLKPISQTAAQQVFADITDDSYEMDEVNRVLNL
ncbi:hypothetical protein C8R46DRAFT_1185568, partial [Mycena filopes]